MTLRIHDTAQRALVRLEVGPVVRMYVCGITPYDSTHLGHAATYITYDLLIRRLEELGHEVRMVRNVTDVDDSILPKARELGVDYLELADAELARFQADMEALGLRPPAAEPRATEAIDGMIEMAAQLLDSGHAYLTHGTVYFDVSTFPRYGELSHYSLEHMIRLARARGGNPDDPHRRAPLDFILWQPSQPGEPAWRSALRRRPPRMAPPVLGDVDGGARPDPRPPRWRHRPDLPAPRVRDRAERVDHRAAVLAALDALGDGQLRGREDVEVTRQPRVRQRPPEERRPAAIRLALMRHHYRAGFEWHDTDLDEGNALLHRLLAAADRPDGADPRPFAERVRARSTPTWTRRKRSRRSTTSPAPSSPVASTRLRRWCCAS